MTGSLASADLEAPAGKSSGVRAVERALSILSAFTATAPERTLEELSEAVGLPKSTVHRLLVSLRRAGFVEPASRQGVYRPGIRSASVGAIAIRSHRPHVAVHRLLEELRTATDETAGLSVLQGPEAICIDRVESPHDLRYTAGLGGAVAAHCAAAGKVLLAGLSDEELGALFPSDGLPPRIERSIQTLTELREHLRVVREQGYAVDNEEFLRGLRCISVPVEEPPEPIRHALTTSGPAVRLTPERVPELVTVLRPIASQIRAHFMIPTW